jgi:hypothetical protein
MRFIKTIFKVAMNKPSRHWKEVECYELQAPKWKPLRLCVHKEMTEDGKGQGSKWAVSDMETGMRVSQFSYPTRDAAVKEAMERLQKTGYEGVMEALEAKKEDLPAG